MAFSVLYEYTSTNSSAKMNPDTPTQYLPLSDRKTCKGTPYGSGFCLVIRTKLGLQVEWHLFRVIFTGNAGLINGSPSKPLLLVLSFWSHLSPLHT